MNHGRFEYGIGEGQHAGRQGMSGFTIGILAHSVNIGPRFLADTRVGVQAREVDIHYYEVEYNAEVTGD